MTNTNPPLFEVSLNELGMDERAMLKLVNRFNEADPSRKYILRYGGAYQNALNNYGLSSYQQGLAHFYSRRSV